MFDKLQVLGGPTGAKFARAAGVLLHEASPPLTVDSTAGLVWARSLAAVFVGVASTEAKERDAIADLLVRAVVDARLLPDTLHDWIVSWFLPFFQNVDFHRMVSLPPVAQALVYASTVFGTIASADVADVDAKGGVASAGYLAALASRVRGLTVAMGAKEQSLGRNEEWLPSLEGVDRESASARIARFAKVAHYLGGTPGQLTRLGALATEPTGEGDPWLRAYRQLLEQGKPVMRAIDVAEISTSLRPMPADADVGPTETRVEWHRRVIADEIRSIASQVARGALAGDEAAVAAMGAVLVHGHVTMSVADGVDAGAAVDEQVAILRGAVAALGGLVPSIAALAPTWVAADADTATPGLFGDALPSSAGLRTLTPAMLDALGRLTAQWAGRVSADEHARAQVVVSRFADTLVAAAQSASFYAGAPRDLFASTDSPPPASVSLGDRAIKTLTLELAVAPLGAGQWVEFSVDGAAAAGVAVLIDGQSVPSTSPDTWRVHFAPGQRYTSIALAAEATSVAGRFLGVRAQLVDAEFRPQHVATDLGQIAVVVADLPEILRAPGVAGQVDDRPGNSTLIGTDEADAGGVSTSIDALDPGGNDWLDLRGGTDRGVGGPGRDVVIGGAGRDILAGGFDDDALYGYQLVPLVDLLDFDDAAAGSAAPGSVGGRDGDWVDGGLGDDLVVGTLGADALLGGDGSDRIVAGAGDDIIWGDRSADPFRANGWQVVRALELGGDPTRPLADARYSVLGLEPVEAGSGDDWIATGAGSDWVFAGRGNDLLDGGDDDDWLVAG
ncbi:MAG: calcium-binding protein, partial [Burkholderiales bacterium]|nr:calcium-binding protein [Burkholderiales bacterium]